MDHLCIGSLGDYMKKLLVIIGIILVFVGIVVTSLSFSTVENSQPVLRYDGPVESWEIEGHYEMDKKLLVYFNPPNLDLYPDQTANIRVEIINPKGNKTVFEVLFSRMFGNPTPPEFSLVSNEGELIVDNPLGEVGGIVPYTGNYLANITTRRFWGSPNLKLYGEIVEREYPNQFFLPIGLGLIVVGCTLTIWGAKSSERKLRPKKKHVETKTKHPH